MNTCPVMQGINMAALSDERQSERQERISERADDLAYTIKRDVADRFIAKHFEDVGGDLLIKAMAHLFTCPLDARPLALDRFNEVCRDAIRPYLLEMAEKQIVAGLDAWGDAE